MIPSRFRFQDLQIPFYMCTTILSFFGKQLVKVFHLHTRRQDGSGYCHLLICRTDDFKSVSFPKFFRVYSTTQTLKFSPELSFRSVLRAPGKFYSQKISVHQWSGHVPSLMRATTPVLLSFFARIWTWVKYDKLTEPKKFQRCRPKQPMSMPMLEG